MPGHKVEIKPKKESVVRFRMSREARRSQLIEIAVKYFSRFGFQGASTKAIAQEAGVTEAIIYRHFATKEHLYSAILDYKLQQFGTQEWINELQNLAAANRDEDLFRSVARKVLDAYAKSPDFQRLMFRAAIENHDLSMLLHEKVGLPVYEFLRDYIARRQREGAFRKCDPGVAVFALVALPNYFGIVSRIFGLKVVKASHVDVLNTATDLILNGMVAPNPQRKNRRETH
ncbi:MAG TPA: TetR/AcrR family transcriptional regulator [Terriglobia bacterium]|nr:TetR/AcrR family transcriptional regulator [Terriglobia bacterium]